MKILGIDPGNVSSGWVLYDTKSHTIPYHGQTDNDALLQTIGHSPCGVVAIEYMKTRGMRIAQEELDTQFMAGRLVQASGKRWLAISRMEVKMEICGDSRANDAAIAQGVRDLFPATGGGKRPKVGTKKQPGPCYGITSHRWQALAVAITAAHKLH